VNELPEDFRDLLLLLVEHEAVFVVVGGHAVAFHGHPRVFNSALVLDKCPSRLTLSVLTPNTP
jgi:hypothetical protein